MPEAETIQAAETGAPAPAPSGNGKQDKSAETAARIERERAVAKAELLRELGLDSDDAMAKFRASREEVEKAKPEIERKEREWKKQHEVAIKERDDLSAQLKAANEQYLAVLMDSRSSEIARQLDAYDKALPDIRLWLDAHTVTEGEGDDAELCVKDGDFKVEFDGKDFISSVVDHLRKEKPHFHRSRMVGGAGVGAGASVSAPNTAPTNLDELAAAFARKATSGR